LSGLVGAHVIEVFKRKICVKICKYVNCLHMEEMTVNAHRKLSVLERCPYQRGFNCTKECGKGKRDDQREEVEEAVVAAVGDALVVAAAIVVLATLAMAVVRSRRRQRRRRNRRQGR